MSGTAGDTRVVDLEGPLEAEVFVVFERDGCAWLTGPCGPAPWRIESRERHPLDLVRRMAIDALGPIVLVHSTSWRWEHDAVVLSFLVVCDASVVVKLEAVPIERADLARSEATAAPTDIAFWQVLEHALRHLAWLAKEDRVVRETVTPPWHHLLTGYVPEPFQQLEVEEAT